MNDSQQKQQQLNDVDQTPSSSGLTGVQSGQVQQNPASQQDVTQAVPNQQPAQQVPSQPEDLPAERQEKKEETSTAAPVGAPSKEGGPAVPVTSEKLVVPSLEKVEVSPELKEIGVEAKSEVPELTPEDAQAGIVHAKESTPVVISEEPSIKLPMSQQQAQQTVKMHKKIKDSLFWFAMLILRQWQMAEKNKKSNIKIKND